MEEEFYFNDISSRKKLVDTEAYTLNKKKPNKLVKFAWDKLIKYGFIEKYYSEVKIIKFRITGTDKDTITKEIYKCINKLRYHHDIYMKPNDYVIIIGERTYFELIEEKKNDTPFITDYVKFMSNDVFYNDPYNGKRIMNFECHIVPSMTGFAIVKKAIIESKK